MNLSRNQSMVLLMNYSAKAPSQMLDYAQKTLLIIYNTSSVKFLKIYRVYNYIIFCADWRSNCVKNLKCSKFYFKSLFPFFKKKKLYALVWIPLETRTNLTKPKSLTNILHILQELLLMVQDLILALKADNDEACFILSGISFHSLGPKLDIVSVPKCAVFMFLLGKCVPLLKL